MTPSRTEPSSIAALFNSIAPSYDRLNHLLSLGIDKSWRRRAIKLIANPSRPQQILDIACGTGDFSITLARKAHPQAHVTGIDLSEGMLQVMRQKVAKTGLQGKISAQLGNSEQLPFPDKSFDCASIAFGIRNFAHREAALAEILRVLKPGGKLVILELSVPQNRLLRALYSFYFVRILPLIGGLVSGNRSAYRYLPASVLKFPQKQEWMQTMRNCQFVQVSHRSLTLGICRLYAAQRPINQQ